MELFLVRHGETDDNTSGIIQGWTDTNLGKRGHQQAQQAAESLDEQFDAIYSSDLKRASQTANPFRAKYPNTPYFEDARLRERNFGDATGTPHSKYDWNGFWSPHNDLTIPNLEPLEQYDDRVRSFIDSLKTSGYRKVLVVTHQGTINRIHRLIDDNHEHTDYKNGDIISLLM